MVLGAPIRHKFSPNPGNISLRILKIYSFQDVPLMHMYYSIRNLNYGEKRNKIAKLEQRINDASKMHEIETIKRCDS